MLTIFNISLNRRVEARRRASTPTCADALGVNGALHVTAAEARNAHGPKEQLRRRCAENAKVEISAR